LATASREALLEVAQGLQLRLQRAEANYNSTKQWLHDTLGLVAQQQLLICRSHQPTAVNDELAAMKSNLDARFKSLKPLNPSKHIRTASKNYTIEGEELPTIHGMFTVHPLMVMIYLIGIEVPLSRISDDSSTTAFNFAFRSILNRISQEWPLDVANSPDFLEATFRISTEYAFTNLFRHHLQIAINVSRNQGLNDGVEALVNLRDAFTRKVCLRFFVSASY